MGTALARAVQRGGYDLAVWNRTAEKLKPFQEDGVYCAPDLATAIKESPVCVVCIDNYDTTRAMLKDTVRGSDLQDRVIVQLSSGTPKEANAASDWLQETGALYLDGAILAGPADIGTADATILLSGNAEAYRRSKGVLECLGDQTVRYLGTNAGAASTLDLAWLMSRYGNFVAALQAAMICKSESVALHEFAALVPDNPAIQYYAQVLQDESFGEFTASLRVWGEALEHIQEQGQDAGINTEIPDFLNSIFKRAIDMNLGETNVMSLIKVLEQKG